MSRSIPNVRLTTDAAVKPMRTLVYKRTHPYDPDECGCFGIQDCMGSVRARKFDAVIGVGGNGVEARSHNINGKVNWIGLGAHKHKPLPGYRGPMVIFEHFVLFEADGPEFRKLACNLAKRIYSTQGRCSFTRFDEVEQSEVDRILKLAESEPCSTWEQDDLLENKQKCRPAFGKVCSSRKRSDRKLRIKC
jgi:hypothetical protein